MANYIFEKGYRSFNEDWLPHANASDIWSLRGLLHRAQHTQSAYAFEVFVARLPGLYHVLTFTLTDLKDGSSRTLHHRLSGMGGDCFFVDTHTLFATENMQMLWEKDVFALRILDEEDCGVELLLERTAADDWFAENGCLPLDPAGRHQVFECLLPRLTCTGRLFVAGQPLQVAGVAAFERLWGAWPLRLSKYHSERWHLFFTSGDEILLRAFPQQGFTVAKVYPTEEAPYQITAADLSAEVVTEREGWRFAQAATLLLPTYALPKLRLSPLSSETPLFPFARPVCGIYDAAGTQLGYALGELFPGARMEGMRRMDMRLFSRS